MLNQEPITPEALAQMSPEARAAVEAAREKAIEQRRKNIRGWADLLEVELPVADVRKTLDAVREARRCGEGLS